MKVNDIFYMNIHNIQSRLPVQPLSLVQAPAQKNAQSTTSPSSSSDAVIKTVPTGSIPAGMAFGIAQATELQDALARLNADPTQANFRKTQANFRVAIRKLDVNVLQQLQKDIQAEISHNANFREQRLLAEISHDVNMEIFTKGGQPTRPALEMPPLPGSTPESIVSGSLKKLASHMSQANFKEALAGFRVALRQLQPADLDKTAQLVSAATQTTQDYRSQLFLEELRHSLISEKINRGLKVERPALTMPPALGSSPSEIASNAVKLLNSNPSEQNFKTAIAAVRVAQRGLDEAGKKALRAAFEAAMQGNHSDRTQVFLDTAARSIY